MTCLHRVGSRDRPTPLRCALKRCALVVFLLIFADQAWSNDDRIYIECPCRLVSDGKSLSITVSARSFRERDAGSTRINVEARQEGTAEHYSAISIGSAVIADTLPSGVTLDSVTVETSQEGNLSGRHDIWFSLDEEVRSNWVSLDRIQMEAPVTLGEAFDISELDYLKDTDGDGVGDINEILESTDPADRTSTPGASTIDILSLYNQRYADLYDGDATTRIQHLVTLANVMFENSGVGIQLRPVGAELITLNEAAGIDASVLKAQVDRHRSDLTVMYRHAALNVCGWSYLGGWNRRGRLDKHEAMTNLSVVTGTCGGLTLTHELGHALGLAHSFLHNDTGTYRWDTGTYRWSRGHNVDGDFWTIMSYAPPRGGTRVDEFSNPRALCSGTERIVKPCGVDRNEVEGADAVTSLEAVRFQVANFQEGYRDTDKDGFVDPVDDLPQDPADWRDTDGDGIGNIADIDDDNDGVNDDLDAFPLDPTESSDGDSDGVGDNSDRFPEDPTEWADTDADGVGDNSDSFPDDPTEWADRDDDGVGDNGDSFPDDPTEWADTDGDGIGNNADPDADGDGIDNDVDLFPTDPTRSDISSYVFVAESEDHQLGESVLGVSDTNAYVILGSPNFDEGRGVVYAINVADLSNLDIADGRSDRSIELKRVPTGPNSWRFIGVEAGDFVGRYVATKGDLNGDQIIDLVFGARADIQLSNRTVRGPVIVFASGNDFESADAEDGEIDGTVSLANLTSQSHSWQLRMNADLCERITSVAITDLDGQNGLGLLAAVRPDCWPSGTERPPPSVYIAPFDEIASADTTDGELDGIVSIEHVVGRTSAFQLTLEADDHSQFVDVSPLGYLNGDGHTVIGIGVPRRNFGEITAAGVAYLISTLDLSNTDAMNEESNGVVKVVDVIEQSRSWKILGTANWERMGHRLATRNTSELVVGAFDRTFILAIDELDVIDATDGEIDSVLTSDRMITATNSFRMKNVNDAQFSSDVDGDAGRELLFIFSGRIYLANADSLASYDARDGAADGDIDPWNIVNTESTWSLRGSRDRLINQLLPAGDLDGDGQIDVMIAEAVRWNDPRPFLQRFTLISGADLQALDRVDDVDDRDILLGNVAGDTDDDGIINTLDRDDDNDGFDDYEDAFQLDATEWLDTDGDRFGDNIDAFPNDLNEQFDTDLDGIGNNADDDDDGDGILDRDDARPLDTDNDGIDNWNDLDDDGDGVNDDLDDLPIDPNETLDTDRDGIGNNADNDDDNDGVVDDEDEFPLDPTETIDSDGDGTGNNADAFPQDPDEQADADGDGIGDNADPDDDNDGVPDIDDEFPYDNTAARDSDGDGVPDSRDALPNDPSEWFDYDGDGIGDNADQDDDNDGVNDMTDPFPKDADRSRLMSLRFVPENVSDMLGYSLSAIDDLDGDGKPEVGLGAFEHADLGAVYLLSSRDFDAADQADGNYDGSIAAEHISTQPYSWKLLGDDEARLNGIRVGTNLAPLHDLNDDGLPEFVIGGTHDNAYIVSGRDLAGMDADDGHVDRVVELSAVTRTGASWRLRGVLDSLLGTSFANKSFSDIESVGWLIGQPGHGRRSLPGDAHLLNHTTLAQLDDSDGTPDRNVWMSYSRGPWRFDGENSHDKAGSSLAMVDFDQDGKLDVLIGTPGHDTLETDDGAVYLVNGLDFEASPTFDLASTANSPNSFEFTGESRQTLLGTGIAIGDIDGDGLDDFVMSGRNSLHIVGGTAPNLTELDSESGGNDGLIKLHHEVTNGHWHIPFSGEWREYRDLRQLATVDANGDNRSDILTPLGLNDARSKLEFLLLPAKSIVSESRERGGSVSVEVLIESSYIFRWDWNDVEKSDYTKGVEVAGLGDLDGDGKEEFLLAAFFSSGSEAYLIYGGEIDWFDSIDGSKDRLIELSTIVRPRD